MSPFVSVFRLLNDADVRYIVVGGIATVLHGYVRTTADIDLIIDLHTEEAEKAIRALSGFGFAPQAPVNPLAFADAGQRNRWIEEKNMTVFSLAHRDKPGLTVDLFARHPIPFDALWSRSVLMDLGDTKVRVCALEDLIALKRLAGRQQDLADIEQLARIKAMEERKDE